MLTRLSEHRSNWYNSTPSSNPQLASSGSKSVTIKPSLYSSNRIFQTKMKEEGDFQKPQRRINNQMNPLVFKVEKSPPQQESPLTPSMRVLVGAYQTYQKNKTSQKETSFVKEEILQDEQGPQQSFPDQVTSSQNIVKKSNKKKCCF